MPSKNSPNLAKKFYCSTCDYRCNKKSDYEKHLSTFKHKIRTNTSEISPKLVEYVCECGKSYKHRQSLYHHKKKCKHNVSSQGAEISSETTMEYLLQENLEMKQMMIELCKKIKPSNITNNTTNNTNNNHFNINVFLNEECKDAMNLTDFIDSIQLSIEDVANIGEKGQTSGFAKILVDKLSALDLYKRPLHCSDAKRETLYVKDNDMWDKEPHDRPRIKQVIDHISMKGIQRVPELDLPNDKMTTTISEIVNTPINHKKIISTVAKEVKI